MSKRQAFRYAGRPLETGEASDDQPRIDESLDWSFGTVFSALISALSGDLPSELARRCARQGLPGQTPELIAVFVQVQSTV